jgi:hydrogenase nickel incorporation protein HypA/HybF
MHELSQIHGLMRQLQSLAQAHGANRVTAVKVKVGALAHCSPEHFREHFAQASQGTLAEGARVDVELASDAFDPQAQNIVLDEFEITYAN